MHNRIHTTRSIRTHQMLTKYANKYRHTFNPRVALAGFQTAIYNKLIWHEPAIQLQTSI